MLAPTAPMAPMAPNDPRPTLVSNRKAGAIFDGLKLSVAINTGVAGTVTHSQGYIFDFIAPTNSYDPTIQPIVPQYNHWRFQRGSTPTGITLTDGQTPDNDPRSTYVHEFNNTDSRVVTSDGNIMREVKRGNGDTRAAAILALISTNRLPAGYQDLPTNH